MSDYKFELGELVRVKESRGFPIYENEVGEVIDREIFKRLTECIKYRVRFDNGNKKAFVENDLEEAQVSEENEEDVFEFEVDDRVRIDYRDNSYWNGKQGKIVDRFKNGKAPAYTVSGDRCGEKDFFGGELELIEQSDSENKFEKNDKVRFVSDERVKPGIRNYAGTIVNVKGGGMYDVKLRGKYGRYLDNVSGRNIELIEKGEKDMDKEEKTAMGDTVEVDLLHEFDYEIPEHVQPLSVDTLERLKNIFFNGVTVVEVVHLGEEKEGEEDWHEHGERIINEVLDIVQANDDYFTVLSGILGEVKQKKLEKFEEDIISENESVEDYFVFLNYKILDGESHE